MRFTERPRRENAFFKLNETNRQELRRRFGCLLSVDFDGALERMEHNGKIILNSDDLFPILPEYASNPNQRPVLGPLLYSSARKFIDRAYGVLLSRQARKDNTVVFTAGGSATGKSTILRTAGEGPGVDFIVDTTFSDTRRAFLQVDQALAHRRKVAIYYVYADFRQSVRWMIRRALNPASGRLVPIDDMARTHFGAQRAILGALQKYQTNRNVFIVLTENSGPGQLSIMKESEFEGLLHNSIDGLQRLGQRILDELYPKEKAAKGQIVVRIKTPEGRVYRFRKLSTKPLDRKLKDQSHRRAKAMREGLRKALKKARAKRISLARLIPVS